MRLDIYLNYRGNCEQAFRFYEQYLGGRVTGMVRHGEQPNPNIPADWKEKILHARIEIGTVLTDGGEIFMKMEKTPFANRFAMLRDKFGTSWMLLHQPEAASRP